MELARAVDSELRGSGDPGRVRRMPRRADPDPPLPDVVTAAEAYAAGLTRDQVRQRVRSGRWRVIARGVYDRSTAHGAASTSADAVAEHIRRAQGAALAFPGSAVVLHSAVLMHGLPLWGPLPDDVAINVPLGKWNGTLPGVVIHRMSMAEGDVVEGRVPVTAVARTCADVARLTTVATGLAAADAAVRSGLADAAALRAAVERSIDRRRIAQGLRVAAHACGLRESPAESASWAYFLRHRVPLPRMQVTLRTRSGRFIARVDFWWDDARLAGECDGRQKYTSPEDIYAEKRREDDIRAEGHQVIRWGPADLATPLLAHRISRFLT